MATMTLGAFAMRLAAGAISLKLHEHEMIEEAAVFLEKEAKAVLGTYDYGWPQLQPATIARKANGNTPLIETGTLRDSIEHNSTYDPLEAYVGTNDPIGMYQEFGTSRGIPPRSFIEATLTHHGQDVADMISHRIAGVFEWTVI